MKELKKMLTICVALLSVALPACQSNQKEEDHGFDMANMDTTANPRTDFYQYAVGNWVKNNPIPPEYSSWQSFTMLFENNNHILRKILDSTVADKNAAPGSLTYKVGTFYKTGLDSAKIEQQGWTPIKDELEAIDKISSPADLANSVAHITLYSGSPLFNFSAQPDAKNSQMEIAVLSQGGLGLPDRDYYLNDDARSKEIRTRYVDYIAKMFSFTGVDTNEAKNIAKRIMALETDLAKNSRSRVELRDPEKNYNKMTLVDLKKISTGFDWDAFFNTMGLSDPGGMDVNQPEFFTAVGKLVKSAPLNDVKEYLKWNVIRSAANYLSSNFVDERFDFVGKFLNGQKKMQPRWKRVLFATSGHLGDAVGELYVKETFPPEAKQRALNIVKNLITAMKERIQGLDWMSEATKEKALYKLSKFTVKIGYPDKWIDYTNLDVKDDSYYQNVMRANYFESKRDIAKIGKPVDKTEWEMSPQTVNAYYEPLRNEIVFPAAILQPPFFNQKADDAINYGAMGAVIGHEITHGFDDQGRQYDAEGNIADWWTKEDADKFKERADKLVQEYDNFNPIDTMHVNGRLTLGENIADLGGLTVSFTAFKNTEQYKENKKIDGFTPAQRFFLGWAQVWANNIRPEYLKLLLKTDVHSPGKERVIGPFKNMPEFFKAYNVQPGDPMRSPDSEIVKIW